MKVPLDPQHYDVPMNMLGYIFGAAFSGLGVIATTLYGFYHQIASLSPEELAIQPLHVILIVFIVALAAFIVLILRAVWGSGISTVTKFSGSLDKLSERMEETLRVLKEIADVQANRLAKLEDLSIDTLRSAADVTKGSRNDHKKR